MSFFWVGHFEFFFRKKKFFFCFIPMKISPNLYGRMDGSKFWCFPWFPENSLLCVILRYTVTYFNPKRCGLFGQLRRRGGSKMTLWEIVVSGSSNFDTDLTDSVSYESWHPQLKFETSLRSLRLILWPQEVSEVTEVKMKKIWDENPRIANFWLREM